MCLCVRTQKEINPRGVGAVPLKPVGFFIVFMPSRKTLGQFINESISKHGDKYDYSLVQYKESHTKVSIVCPAHGVFIQEPNEHLKGCGCPECGKESKLHHYPRSNGSDFIKKANKIHKGMYLYDKVLYKNSKKQVVITCKKHGDFRQTPNAHLSRRGCPKCFKYYQSKGESDIAEWLTQHHVLFEEQKTFKTNPPFNRLRYDFYLPKYNIVIEFNGQQHYKPISFFGDKKGYEQQYERDQRKRIFCKNHNIKLIIITYKEMNKISIILDSLLAPAAR